MSKYEQSPDSPEKESWELERELELIQPALRAYIGSLVGPHGEVSDILQEANILIWDRRKEFVPGSNFKAWVFRIAYFKTLAHRRDIARRGKFIFNDELTLELAADAKDLFEDSGHERNEALAACVAELSEEQRSLLEEHYFDRVSVTEIALRSGCKPTSLHKVISRIRLALRRCMHQRLT